MTAMERITKVFREVFDDPTLVVSDNTTAAHIAGWDSFAHINLIVGLEEEFGVNITTKELGELTCVGDVRKLLERKAAQ